MELGGKVALITGGKRIGAAVATELGRRGVDIALTFRRSVEEAEATAAAVRAMRQRAIVIQADLGRPGDCTRAVDETVGAFGRLDILVNMASVYRPTPVEAITVDDWNEQLDVDLRSAWLCARAAIPHMRRHGGGRIVNFSDWVSASGRPRYPGFLTYYVAKGAVIALTEALALELAADQILVNAVAPGPIVAPEGTTEAEHAAVERSTPLGRWGGALEAAKAVLALVETEFVTGETIRVDGGRHLR